jgi:ATP-dependent helicase/nuclease subunit B
MKRAQVIVHRPGFPFFDRALAEAVRHAEEARVCFVVPSQKRAQDALRCLSHETPWLQKRLDICTFDRFVRRLVPRSERKLLTPAEQKLAVLMAVERAARQQSFQYFHHSLTHIGWLLAIEDWIGEMKRAAVSVEQLRHLWADGTPKQQELLRIFASYQALLNEWGVSDHEEEYRSMLGWLEDPDHPLQDLPDRVILTHFYDVNLLQARVLQVLAERGNGIDFHLEYDAARRHVFREAERTLAILQAAGFSVSIGEEESGNGQRTEGMQFLVDHLFDPAFLGVRENAPNGPDAGQAVEWIETPTRWLEVEAVAARIKTLVRDEGYALTEIGILVPDMQGYREILPAVMEKAGIPLDLEIAQCLSENPLIQSILQLLRARMDQNLELTPVWLSPYFPWGDQAGELVELYREAGKPATADEWQAVVEQGDSSFSSSVPPGDKNRVRELRAKGVRLYQLLAQIPDAATAGQYSFLLRSLEDWGEIRLGLRRLLEDEDEEAYRLVARDLKALNAWHEVLDEIARVAAMAGEAEEKIPLEEYVRRLQLACDNKEFVEQTGVRGGVQVAHPNHIRGRMWRAVFCVGMVEGVFPRRVSNDWLLPDEERRGLEEARIRLWTSRELTEGQNYRFFMAVASAREKLILSRPLSGSDGKEHLRSSYVDEVLRFCHKERLTVHRITLSDLVPKTAGDCVTLERWTEKAIADLASGRDIPSSWMAYSPLRQRLSALYPRMRAEWERRGRELGGFDGILQTSDVQQRVREILTRHVWSASQLESLMQCRFAFFAERLLRLSPREEDEESMSPAVQGSLLHLILFRFLREKKGIDWRREEKDILLQELIACAREELFRYRQTRMFRGWNDLLWQMEEERLLLHLKRFFEVEWKRRECDQIGLQPELLEFSFGLPVQEGEMDERSCKENVTLSIGGQSIRLRGKIDRVDLAADGRFVVYDYKKGKAPSAKQVRDATHIQLPLYLWILEQTFGFEMEKALGAAYFTKDDRNQGIWRKEALNDVGISPRVGSKVDREEWETVLQNIATRIAETLQLARQGNFAVDPAIECPSYCAFRHICRFSADRMRKKAGDKDDSAGDDPTSIFRENAGGKESQNDHL